MSWLTEYKNSLKMSEVEEYFDLFFYRPLAFLLVKLIYPTRITPNQLTLIAIFFGIFSGFMYAMGSPNDFVIGALFFVMYNIFDCSDGQLARLKKNGTHVGRIIDGIADYIATISVFIGIGIGFANQQKNPVYWWSLVVITGFSNVIHSILVDYYRNRFLDYVLQRKSTFTDDLESFREKYKDIRDQKNKWLDRIIIKLYLGYSLFQNKLIVKDKNEIYFIATPDDYYKKNKAVIKLWTIIGPTSQITMLVICSLLNRIDLFFWIIIIVFNSIAVMSWIFQGNIDKSFKQVN